MAFFDDLGNWFHKTLNDTENNIGNFVSTSLGLNHPQSPQSPQQLNPQQIRPPSLQINNPTVQSPLNINQPQQQIKPLQINKPQGQTQPQVNGVNQLQAHLNSLPQQSNNPVQQPHIPQANSGLNPQQQQFANQLQHPNQPTDFQSQIQRTTSQPIVNSPLIGQTVNHVAQPLDPINGLVNFGKDTVGGLFNGAVNNAKILPDAAVMGISHLTGNHNLEQAAHSRLTDDYNNSLVKPFYHTAKILPDLATGNMQALDTDTHNSLVAPVSNTIDNVAKYFESQGSQDTLQQTIANAKSQRANIDALEQSGAISHDQSVAMRNATMDKVGRTSQIANNMTKNFTSIDPYQAANDAATAYLIAEGGAKGAKTAIDKEVDLAHAKEHNNLTDPSNTSPVAQRYQALNNALQTVPESMKPSIQQEMGNIRGQSIMTNFTRGAEPGFAKVPFGKEPKNGAPDTNPEQLVSTSGSLEMPQASLKGDPLPDGLMSKDIKLTQKPQTKAISLTKSLEDQAQDTPLSPETARQVRLAKSTPENQLMNVNTSTNSIPLDGSLASVKVNDLLHHSNTALDLNNTGDFYRDLESNIKKVRGNYEANRLLTTDVIKKANKAYQKNPADFEAAYHYAENPDEPLTVKQKELFDKYVQPLRDSINEGTNELKGTEFEGNEDHIPRIALGKTSNAEQYLTGNRASPTEGVLRKSADAASKKRTMYALTDEEGNRTVASIKTLKDELGKATGDKRVTAFRNGENEDIGAFRLKSNEDLLERDLKPYKGQLQKIAQEVKALESVKTKGGVSDTRLKALAEKGAQLKFLKDEGNKLTPAERRSLRDTASKFQELQRVKPTKTNVDTRLATLSKHASDALNVVNEITSKYDPENLHGKVFIDKDGKRYTVGDATTKEIEQHTNVKYLHNPVITTALAHTNIRNAVNANKFNEWMRLHPDYSDHAVKVGEGTVPDGWKTVDSPYFRGWYFDPKTAKIIDNQFGGGSREGGIIAKGFNGIMSPIIQMIVSNPLIHGQNLYQLASEAVGGKNPTKGAAGFVHTNGIAGKMIVDSKYRQGLVQQYLRDGGHLETFGSDRDTFLTKAADAANIPHFSKTNAAAMRDIETTLRSSAHEANLANGVSPSESIARIDKFMGDKEHIPEVAQAIGMFYHYLTTLTHGTAAMVRHPLTNSGAITNALLGGAVVMGTNYALQQWTGNQNAKIRNPGEIGFVKDLVQAPGQLAGGSIPSLVTGHINPLISTGLDLAYGKNLSTGQELNTPTDKAKDALNRLVAPAGPVTKIGQNKETPGEYLLNQGLGIYTPHATGDKAIPNSNNPLANLINTPGSKTEKTGDPTGYTQQSQYYNEMSQLKGGMDTNEKAAYDSLYPASKDSNGNYVIQPTVWDSSKNATTLLANPKLLSDVTASNQALAQKGNNVDPFFTKLTPDQQKSVLQHEADADLYKANYGQEKVWMDNHPWYSQFSQDRSAWYNTLPPGDPNKPKSPVQPPNESQDVQQLYQQYNAINNSDATQQAKDRAVFISAHPALDDYMKQTALYTNKLLEARGAQPIKLYPTTDKDTQNFMQSYLNAKNPDGSSDSATRKAMKAANPDLYGKMQAFMSLVTEWDLNRQASLDSIEGQQPSQKYLKDVLNMGNFDIYRNPDGSLALNGTSNLKDNAVHTTSANGNGSGGSGGGKIKVKKQHKPRIRVRRQKVRYYSVSKDKRIHFKAPPTKMGKTTITPGKISIVNPLV